MSVRLVVENQRSYFQKDYTRPINFRIRQLRKLKNSLKHNEKVILDALYNDLGKSQMEAYMTELSVVYQELNEAIKHLKTWATPKK